MLCNVDARSRPAPQVVEKSELPKAFEGSMYDVRWGIEPALRRDSKADVSLGVRTVGLVALLVPTSFSVGAKTVDLKGRPEAVPPGNLEGTVPARALRVGLKRLLSAGGAKSGKPS